MGGYPLPAFGARMRGSRRRASRGAAAGRAPTSARDGGIAIAEPFAGDRLEENLNPVIRIGGLDTSTLLTLFVLPAICGFVARLGTALP